MTDRDAGDLVGFATLVERATGHRPYDYQSRLAEEGLPELLRVETGAGKTVAATLPWLFRRRFHPDALVRGATPHWLVYVLPMRVLVEQTHSAVAGWLGRLGLADAVGLHLVMGGESIDSGWRLEPERDAIFIGTQDMLVSRALNRGYGQSRWAWPIDFGLFNNGCHFVYDEVQLMGPALPTSRQLEGLRRAVGTALPCASTWMSATVEDDQLLTVDLPDIASTVELGADDRSGPLAARLDATKTIRRLDVDPKRYARSLADALGGRGGHRPGTLTIAMLNTVDRAVELHQTIAATSNAETVLVHSRFRPLDRVAVVARALAQVDPHGPGRIVVSTQVLEAGIDVSATTLFTEAAPWPSIVQRAGRCNRDGRADNASLLWCEPPPKSPGPYLPADLETAGEALSELEGVEVTPSSLGTRRVPVSPELHPVLRRRDLFELFDTIADLTGNDLDVSRFIRSADEIDAYVAWQHFGDGGPAQTDPPPTRDERCPVPVGQLKGALEGRDAWRYDPQGEEWVRARPNEVRPGMVLLLRADEGGYDPALGWSPSSARPVQPVGATPEPLPLTETDEAVGDDPVTYTTKRWVGLHQHLQDVEREVGRISAALAPQDLKLSFVAAATVAGRLHDLGKAHPAFQQMLAGTAADDEQRSEAEAVGRPWAKSAGSHRTRNSRHHFRHELVSALALLGEGSVALDGVEERDLVVYLVASHHGRVRLGFRSLPDERPPPDRPDRLVALGVWDGERLPEVEVPGGVVPAATLDLSVMTLGADERKRSWSRRMLALRDRDDLGPFRLGFLEAVVRLADWRASADAEHSPAHVGGAA